MDNNGWWPNQQLFLQNGGSWGRDFCLKTLKIYNVFWWKEVQNLGFTAKITSPMHGQSGFSDIRVDKGYIYIYLKSSQYCYSLSLSLARLDRNGHLAKHHFPTLSGDVLWGSWGRDFWMKQAHETCTGTKKKTTDFQWGYRVLRCWIFCWCLPMFFEHHETNKMQKLAFGLGFRATEPPDAEHIGF